MLGKGTTLYFAFSGLISLFFFYFSVSVQGINWKIYWLGKNIINLINVVDTLGNAAILLIYDLIPFRGRPMWGGKGRYPPPLQMFPKKIYFYFPSFFLKYFIIKTIWLAIKTQSENDILFLLIMESGMT